MEQHRTLRIKKINPFTLNDGRILKKNFIIVVYLDSSYLSKEKISNSFFYYL